MSIWAAMKGFQLGKGLISLGKQALSQGFTLSKGKEGATFNQRGSVMASMSGTTGINQQYLTYGAVALGLYLLMKR
jgi:hypothetical protein